jgi:hypothetical protein
MSGTHTPRKQFREIGAVRRVVEMPCSVPPLIYIETFRPAVMAVIWSNSAPVWKQYVKAATGKSWLKHVKMYLADAEDELHPKLNKGLEKLYTVAEFLDKSVFYLWVAGMTEEFAYDWASLIHEYTPCHKSGDNQIASGASCIGGLPPNGSWVENPAYIRTAGSGGGLVTASVFVPPNTTYDMLYSVHFPNSTNGTYKGAMRVRSAVTGEIYAASGDCVTTLTSGADGIVYASALPGGQHGTQYIAECRAELLTGSVSVIFFSTGYLSIRRRRPAPITNPKPTHEAPPRTKTASHTTSRNALGKNAKGKTPPPKMVGKIRMCWIDGRWQPCPLKNNSQLGTIGNKLSTLNPKK